MAVTKRLRYEVLNRDGHRCRYCGITAAETKLVVDAVIPEALGGSHKDPANLATACEPCNSGKTSSHPDAPKVADVAEDALRWSHAIAVAAEEMLTCHDEMAERYDQFCAAWDGWTYGSDKQPVPKDDNWQQSVASLLAAGLPMALLEECVQIAMTRQKVQPENTFKYMCGVAWHKVREIQKRARELADGTAVTGSAGPDSREEVRAGFADELLSKLDDETRSEFLEAVDTREYCRDQGETVPTYEQILQDAAEYALSHYAEQLDFLQEQVFLALEEVPDQAGTRAMQAARTFLYEHWGASFSKVFFLTNSLRHLTDELKYPAAERYLRSLSAEEGGEWLAFASAFHDGRMMTAKGISVAAALAAQDVPANYTWRSMCLGKGEHIIACPRKGAYLVRLAELKCCGPEGPGDHKGHLFCEQHLEHLIDGTFISPKGRSYTVTDYTDLTTDAWAEF